METKVENLSKSRVKLMVTVPPKELVDHFKHSFEELAATVKLPGFRPGKAPRRLVESSLGVAKILSHALDHALQHNYIKALNQEKLFPVASPNVVINKYPAYGLDAEEIASDLEFEAEVDVFPKVELGDYTKLKVDQGDKKEIKEEDVEKVVSHLQKQQAKFSDVEREAKKGDFVEIDFEGFERGVKIDQMSSKHHPIVLGEDSLITGFEEEIVGLKKDEEKTFKLKFPKDYHAKEYAGKEAEFRVKLNQVKEIELPPVDDQFAKNFDHQNAAELRQAIKKSLEAEAEHQNKHELEEKVVEKVLLLVQAEIPDSMIRQEWERMLETMKKKVASSGMNFESYLSSMKKTEVDMEKELRPQAEKNIKISLMLGEIIKREKIDPNDEKAGQQALNFLVKELTK